jgi:hypothetical protein
MERNEAIEKVVNRTRVEAELLTDLRAGPKAVAETREESELDRRQERLRGPEPHPNLHDVTGVDLPRRALNCGHGASLYRGTRSA